MYKVQEQEFGFSFLLFPSVNKLGLLGYNLFQLFERLWDILSGYIVRFNVHTFIILLSLTLLNLTKLEREEEAHWGRALE